MGQLLPEQIFLIELIAGIVAAVVVQIAKWVLAGYGVKIGRRPVTILLFVISLLLGFWWLAPQIPPFPALVEDTGLFVGLIVGWLAQIVTLLVTLVGFATTIYNLLMQKVFDKIGQVFLLPTVQETSTEPIPPDPQNDWV